jgi:hypothetical protein
MSKELGPDTLLEAVTFFANYENCKGYMVDLRWGGKVTCPSCGSAHVTYLDRARLWKCYEKHEHTNGMENFWSLLKRTIGGTYVSVEPFHLFRYVDEQAFRFNNRIMNDGLRFRLAMRHIVGKRLTYAELTGKTEEGPRQEEEPF